MPKTITIDTAVVAQVRLTTDASGAIRVYCDYTLAAGAQPIQETSEDVTALLSSGDQGSALSVFKNVLQALGNSQSVTAIGVAAVVQIPSTKPAIPAAGA